MAADGQRTGEASVPGGRVLLLGGIVEIPPVESSAGGDAGERPIQDDVLGISFHRASLKQEALTAGVQHIADGCAEIEVRDESELDERGDGYPDLALLLGRARDVAQADASGHPVMNPVVEGDLGPDEKIRATVIVLRVGVDHEREERETEENLSVDLEGGSRRRGRRGGLLLVEEDDAPGCPEGYREVDLVGLAGHDRGVRRGGLGRRRAGGGGLLCVRTGDRQCDQGEHCECRTHDFPPVENWFF